MSHHSLPKKWRRSAVTVVLVPSLMCGGHAVVAPTASAAPASSTGSSNVGSTGSAALPGIPDNIIRVLGPALPIMAFLATVFAAATAFSRSGSHTSHSTSTNPSPSTSAEATTSGSQQPTTPSTSVEAPAPTASEHPTATAEAVRPVQTNGTANQGSKTGSSSPNNRGAGTPIIRAGRTSLRPLVCGPICLDGAYCLGSRGRMLRRGRCGGLNTGAGGCWLLRPAGSGLSRSAGGGIRAGAVGGV